jgi:hypothetical protein
VVICDGEPLALLGRLQALGLSPVGRARSGWLVCERADEAADEAADEPQQNARRLATTGEQAGDERREASTGLGRWYVRC